MFRTFPVTIRIFFIRIYPFLFQGACPLSPENKISGLFNHVIRIGVSPLFVSPHFAGPISLTKNDLKIHGTSVDHEFFSKQMFQFRFLAYAGPNYRNITRTLPPVFFSAMKSLEHDCCI